MSYRVDKVLTMLKSKNNTAVASMGSNYYKQYYRQSDREQIVSLLFTGVLVSQWEDAFPPSPLHPCTQGRRCTTMQVAGELLPPKV